MSGRFVRSTKFRHVFGTPFKKDKCYDNIRITKGPWESNMCSVNGKFIAVVLESQGGGAFMVAPLGKTGRFDLNYPKVCGHKNPVMDLAWNPFNDNQIASCSEDCTIKIWDIPDEGISANLEEPVMNLECHQRKVGLVCWHPTAENILASGGHDGLVVVWNLETGDPLYQIDIGDHPNGMCWNEDGSLLGVTCKDKKLKLIDPRKGEIIAEVECHAGTKPAKLAFCGKYIFTAGFSRSNERQYALWNPADLRKPLTIEGIDQASGVQNVFYDPGTRMVYLVGKGDSTIRFYEVTDEKPYVFFLSMYQSKDPQRGAGSMPKRHLNHMECEVMRFYKLQTKGLIEPITMTVPRKSEMFQEDIYPPCYAGQPALSATEWMEGANKKPITQAITKDGLGATAGGGVTSPVRIANVGTGSGQLSKQSSISSSASGADHASLRIERENSPISLTASGDFDDSQYKKEIQSLSSQLQELRNENERLRAELKEKDSIIKQVRQLVK